MFIILTKENYHQLPNIGPTPKNLIKFKHRSLVIPKNVKETEDMIATKITL